MSMMLVWYTSVIVGCDRRRSRLPNAPVEVEYGNNITKE